MSTLKTAYLPIDRALALARGESLAEASSGAALFADISGFTPLTEALRQALGERRGAEELTRHLNAVYEALIREVHGYGGSVIGFAGDAITCWFDDSPPPFSVGAPDKVSTPDNTRPGGEGRAAAAALAMQTAMQRFAAIELPDGASTTLALKIAIASGPVRRLVVGEPAIQLLEVLVGATVERMVRAEHLANPGEIVVDKLTALQLRAVPHTREWRVDRESGEHFAVLSGQVPAVASPWPSVPPLPDGRVRPWLLPAVHAQLDAGLGEFLTELRPAVALFLRFGGLDYTNDAGVGLKLDGFIRQVQAILQRYEGTLLQLTVGDKGSYLYAAFGAPVAHEDDAERALRAAIALQAIPGELTFLEALQIGLSRGALRVGAYGSTTRRTYGALGDEVNLAARLMQEAMPGQILISQRVAQELPGDFTLRPLTPVPIKGKRDPVAVLAFVSIAQVHFQEPVYSLPMIGRQAELDHIEAALQRSLQGQGQVIGLNAEAGLGKSRLVAEVVRRARRRFRILGGACQSYGTTSSYLVWQPIWRSFLHIDPQATLAQHVASLQAALEHYAPARREAWPLLGEVLNLTLPDNAFTATLEPRYRKTALEALLLDCLQTAAQEAAAQHSGLLFILEDLHWIDPASRELLHQVALAVTGWPVCLLLVYRPPLPVPALETLPAFSAVGLAELSTGEAEELIGARLAQAATPVPPAFIEAITQRAEGNPFYIEELLNYMQDRGVAVPDPAALASLELPASLHSLILTRIDQLSERQKTTLRVASIIGRLFRFQWLHGYYPGLGDRQVLREDLEALARLDITPLDTPEPELAYLFKHIITHEVAYESIDYATRAALHAQFGRYLEQEAGDDSGRFLDLLAFHYERSDNLPKKRHYLRRAGEAAARRFDNTSALDYLSRALALAPPDDLAERFDLLRTREKIYSIVTDMAAEKADLEVLEALAEQLDDNARRATVAVRRSFYERIASNYEASIDYARRAVAAAQAAGLLAEELTAYVQWATALGLLGQYPQARSIALECLHRAHTHQQTRAEAFATDVLATISKQEGNYAQALEYVAQSLARQQELGDKVNLVTALHQATDIARHLGDLPTALRYSEQALTLSQEIGDRRGMSTTLRGMSIIKIEQKDYNRAQDYIQQSLDISRALGSRFGMAYSLNILASIYYEQGAYARALEVGQEALALHQELKDAFSIATSYNNLAVIECKLGPPAAARPLVVKALQQALAVRSTMLHLIVLGEAGVMCYLTLGNAHRAAELGGLVVHHPATPAEVRNGVAALYPELEAALGPAGLATALAQGQRLDPETTVEEVLAALTGDG